MSPSLMSRAILVLIGAAALSSASQATVIYYEVTQGDLSNSPSAPTAIVLPVGTSSVIGAVNGATDFQDWFSITVPAGHQLSMLTLMDYDSFDSTAFTGFQGGSTFVGNVFDPTSYWGYSHLSVNELGENLLSLMADANLNPGAQGFSPPLAAGTYTFLVQQIGDDTLYNLEFEVTPVPAPATLGLGTAALCRLGMRRRRR